jgi:alpha-tubulin suppressor-like RCC1 family protein
MKRGLVGFLWGLLLVAQTVCPAMADSSSPLLAAYYDRQMAIVDGVVYGWRGEDRPTRLSIDIGPAQPEQVGVGRQSYYVLTSDKRLIRFREDPPRSTVLMSGIHRFAAGDSGVLAISESGALWWIVGSANNKRRIADKVMAAAVGDSANYYVTNSGALFVKGKAHRGQYGDGRLQSTDAFVQTASDVAQITAHTGHAILLKTNGIVMGTGGNIYGPVGRHGLGDKADRWSKIISGIQAIATGSSHTLAIRRDGTLMAWGSEYGPEPRRIMADVVAVAAGSSTTVAFTRDGILWQWDRGEAPRRVKQFRSR